ncbi:MAG: hypothetical protein H6641_05105 [Caldilineaceae bacterium]|nr:hypothetical protein [Caldilineaceae bacterium]
MAHSTPLRVLFWGTRSTFSGAIFHALQSAGVDICALFMHAPSAPWQSDLHPRRVAPFAFPPYGQANADNGNAHLAISLDLATAPESTLIAGSRQSDAPVYDIFSLQTPELPALIRRLQPHVACVACFPQRIPSDLLHLPRHGFLNVHPSLLPAHRGPAPLFWIFRNGTQATAGGVTIHHMDARFDTGPMAAQVAVALADGISGPEAEQRCTQKGGELLVQVLQALAAGNLVSQPQPAGGSYQSWPQTTDFRLDTNWSARRAFNFMCGVAEWGTPFAVEAAGETIHLRRAIAYDAGQKLSTPVRYIDTSLVELQFSPGVLVAQQ